MSRRVRRLLLLGVAVGGLWAIGRIVLGQVGTGLRPWGRGRSPGPSELTSGHRTAALPAAPPITDLDVFRSQRAAAPSISAAASPLQPPPDAPDSVPDVDIAGNGAEGGTDIGADADAITGADAGAITGADAGAPPTPAPASRPAGGRSEQGNLDKVRERLASIHVDVPPVRGGTSSVAVGAPTRSGRTRRPERWQEPAADGTCDQDHPVKVKMRSGLFHLPGMFAYDRARADRCYRSSADAEDDGFQRAKR
ncbi:MAG: hypothetical protein M3137_08390 [Actinomycetota bacterium]|nr:hypothetical protein [Actinomycetota bacterium]